MIEQSPSPGQIQFPIITVAMTLLIPFFFSGNEQKMKTFSKSLLLVS